MPLELPTRQPHVVPIPEPASTPLDFGFFLMSCSSAQRRPSICADMLMQGVTGLGQIWPPGASRSVHGMAAVGELPAAKSGPHVRYPHSTFILHRPNTMKLAILVVACTLVCTHACSTLYFGTGSELHAHGRRLTAVSPPDCNTPGACARCMQAAPLPPPPPPPLGLIHSAPASRLPHSLPAGRGPLLEL